MKAKKTGDDTVNCHRQDAGTKKCLLSTPLSSVVLFGVDVDDDAAAAGLGRWGSVYNRFSKCREGCLWQLFAAILIQQREGGDLILMMKLSCNIADALNGR